MFEDKMESVEATADMMSSESAEGEAVAMNTEQPESDVDLGTVESDTETESQDATTATLAEEPMATAEAPAEQGADAAGMP